jgi:uncharacterized protein (DUF952 family)
VSGPPPQTPDLERAADEALFHIAEPQDWIAGAEQYTPQRYEDEGFIHLSAGHQVLATTARHYEGRVGLLLLALDPDGLPTDHLRWEKAPHGETFPHLYAPIPRAAVTAACPWPPAD